jgi:hypothetical protein
MGMKIQVYKNKLTNPVKRFLICIGGDLTMSAYFICSMQQISSLLVAGIEYDMLDQTKLY